MYVEVRSAHGLQSEIRHSGNDMLVPSLKFSLYISLFKTKTGTDFVHLIKHTALAPEYQILANSDIYSLK